MLYLEQIIGKINSDLIRQASTTEQAGPLSDLRFQKGRIEGIAIQADISMNDTPKVLPMVYKQTGDYKEVTFDDVYPVIIYHRILSSSNVRDKSKDVGRDKRFQIATSTVQMVVMGFRDKVKMSKESLAALISVNFPTGDGYVIGPVRQTILTVLDMNMDSLSVFAQEFRGVKVKMNQERMIFSIKYKIESSYYTGCFNICDCTEQ